MAYSQILDVFQAQKKLKLSEDKVALLLARYLNATFMMSKWRYFDDQPTTHGVWTNVHKVIKIAENLAIMNKKLFLYGSQSKETSIASILKCGFMVDTLHKGSYTNLEIELTDRILKMWGTNPVMVKTYKENRYHFFIALEEDKGPERIRMKEKFAECRYWKTTRLVDLMEAYLCAVDLQKPIKEFGLEKVASSSTIVKLFKKLRVDWCVEGYARQRRAEQRNQRNSLLNISYGINSVYQRLMAQQKQQQLEKVSDDGFTFELKVATHKPEESEPAEAKISLENENKWMVDESKSGFAIDYGREVPSWVEIGVLVGYSETEFKKTFNLAEVRSVRKQSDGSYRAGFKKISHNAAAIKVTTIERTSVSEPVDGFFLDDGQMKTNYSDEFPGVLVDNDSMHTLKLLLPRKQFKRNLTYVVNLGGDKHKVLAGKVIEKHHDWVLFETILDNE